MGVDANGGVEIFEAGGEFDGLLVFPHVGADGYPSGDAGLSAAVDNAVNVLR
jgi:hypothetical protein